MLLHVLKQPIKYNDIYKLFFCILYELNIHKLRQLSYIKKKSNTKIVIYTHYCLYKSFMYILCILLLLSVYKNYKLYNKVFTNYIPNF